MTSNLLSSEMLVCAQLWHGPVARTLAALQLPLLAQLGICPDAGRLPRRRMSWLANILVGTRKLTNINQINQINQTKQTNYAFLKSTILLCFCKRQLDNQPIQWCNQPAGQYSVQSTASTVQLHNMPQQTISSRYVALDTIMNRAADMDLDTRQFVHHLAIKHSSKPVLQPYEIAMYVVLLVLTVMIVVIMLAS